MASRVRPLGSYRVALQAQGSSAGIDLSTSKGPLMLTGNGMISQDSTSFNGTATSTPDQRENLAGLLNRLGRGTYGSEYRRADIDTDTLAR